MTWLARDSKIIMLMSSSAPPAMRTVFGQESAPFTLWLKLPAWWRLTVSFPKMVVSHCLLVETNGGLVLVDTGVGLEFFQDRPNS